MKAFGKAEVTQFAYALFEQNIGWLEVSMNNSIFVQILGSINNVFEVALGFLLWDFFLLVEHLKEITVVAKLSDDIHVIGSLVDVEELNDVGVGDFLHDVDL